MSDESFEEKIWEQGAIFYHNTDKDGHKVCKYLIKIILFLSQHSQFIFLFPFLSRCVYNYIII